MRFPPISFLLSGPQSKVAHNIPGAYQTITQHTAAGPGSAPGLSIRAISGKPFAESMTYSKTSWMITRSKLESANVGRSSSSHRNPICDWPGGTSGSQCVGMKPGHSAFNFSYSCQFDDSWMARLRQSGKNSRSTGGRPAAVESRSRRRFGRGRGRARSLTTSPSSSACRRRGRRGRPGTPRSSRHSPRRE